MNHECFQIIFYLIFYLTRLIKRLLDTFWLSSSIRHNSFILTFLSSVLTLAYLRPHDPSIFCCLVTCLRACVCSTDYKRPMKHFFTKFQTLGLEQTIWADKFWGIWGIFGQLISTHFCTVCPLSIFSINQPLFLQKAKPLHPNPTIFGIGIWIWAAKN